MNHPLRTNMEPVTRAESAVQRVDMEATIRIVPTENVPVETGRFFLPEKASGRAFRFELGTALRRLTASAPRVDARALARQSPQFLTESPIGPADWQRWGTAFVQDATVVLGGALAQLAEASRRLARASLLWLTRHGWASWLDALLSIFPGVATWAYGGRRREQMRVVRSRMSDSEIAMLDAIARSWGCAPSEVVRILVVQQCQILAGDRLAILRDSHSKRRSMAAATIGVAAPRHP